MGKLKVSALAFGEQLNRPLGSNKVMNLLRQNDKLCLMVDQLRLSKSFPIDLVKELERELRRVVKCEDKNATLYDLLT
ncbi:hypothetical protein, partial [uncultured Nostoc sp.]|uniref:hypothetical protein n=1 Tax=uncultured Nostoc sp. TaxID=340711 RepID=UPI0035CAE372